MSFWSGKKVLITGHTGFKGSWLTLWLKKLGAEVIGYALEPPTTPNLYNLTEVNNNIISVIGDIRDRKKLFETINKYRPEIIFHLAAQPLVRESYINPMETFEINIMGTANLLNAIRNSDSARVVINVTSDKCYDNKEWIWGYRETDTLGGYDPYSCSKACSEIVTNSFRQSYLQDKNIFLSSVRAGNVIGGGDWAEDRIVPDIIKAIINKKILTIRNPLSIRPWQHVLEPLNGYILLAEAMWSYGSKYSEAWNFGPNDDHIISVEVLTNKILNILGNDNKVIFGTINKETVNMHEAKILKLDSSKSMYRLGWKPKLNMEDTIKWTVEWYKSFDLGDNIQEYTSKQIDSYINL